MRSKRIVFKTSWPAGLLQISRQQRWNGFTRLPFQATFIHKYHWIGLWFLSNWKSAFLATRVRELAGLNLRGHSEAQKHSHEKSPGILNFSWAGPQPPYSSLISSERKAHDVIHTASCAPWREEVIFGRWDVFMIQVALPQRSAWQIQKPSSWTARQRENG